MLRPIQLLRLGNVLCANELLRGGKLLCANELLRGGKLLHSSRLLCTSWLLRATPTAGRMRYSDDGSTHD